MKIAFVDLKRQYASVQEEVQEGIARVLEGMHLFLGENVQALEQEFASYCGTRFAVGVGSGTDALYLALRACGIGQGDEVITVSHTFIATAEAIALAGAVPVFVDIDPETYNMDPSNIEKKITSRTRALLPVHLYGHPAEMGPMLDIAREYGLRVIEDACQAHGAHYHGKGTGSLGDLGCFSFYFSKNLGAYGEGGMVTTDDPQLADTVRLLRNHGSRSKYEHALLGVNSRLDEIQATVLRIKLARLEAWNSRRRELAELYARYLPSWMVKPTERPGCRHVYHLYVVRTPLRDELREWLKQCGIEAGIHYPVPIHRQPACQAYLSANGSLPATERAVGEILSLPMYPELQEEEVRFVCDSIRRFFEDGAGREAQAVQVRKS